jgi:hypothetical protein
LEEVAEAPETEDHAPAPAQPLVVKHRCALTAEHRVAKHELKAEQDAVLAAMVPAAAEVAVESDAIDKVGRSTSA